jgi:hypothetical protein
MRCCCVQGKLDGSFSGRLVWPLARACCVRASSDPILGWSMSTPTGDEVVFALELEMVKEKERMTR